MFLRNLLLNEKNELHNRDLHISGFWTTKKVDIQTEKADDKDPKADILSSKVDIQDSKVDIEDLLAEKAKDFSAKTVSHIRRMFDAFGYDTVFARSAIVELLGIQNSGASKLLSRLRQAGIIEPVSGKGKGKYKFTAK